MIKMIAMQSLVQLAITFTLNFGGMSFFGYPAGQDGERRLKSLVFNTFVFLQIFNEIKFVASNILLHKTGLPHSC